MHISFSNTLHTKLVSYFDAIYNLTIIKYMNHMEYVIDLMADYCDAQSQHQNTVLQF
ncbi:hypothetical protein HanIR_Chr02g0056111 [Helianthus annuus]|nr:hypothetical protein HanIR_Chr02g0056111 [Helianthus annuus]